MISIVTTYYNRKKLFENTLKTIMMSEVKDFELIVVDDGSAPGERLEDLEKQHSFLKVIRIEPDNKWYVNPCIPFNIGIREARGDKIILQNPECLHVHDILKYVNEYLTDKTYLTFSAYGLDWNTNKYVPEFIKNNKLDEFLRRQPQRAIYADVTLGWYNHPKYRPVYYHFCSAITRTNMKKLNGFDERFANGVGFDDDEFLNRVKLIIPRPNIVESTCVIHQFHESHYQARPNLLTLSETNRSLYDRIILLEDTPHAPNVWELWD